MSILRNFQEHLIYRTPPAAASEIANFVWNELNQYFKGHARLIPLNPQTVIFGLLGMDEKIILLKITFYYFLKYVFIIPGLLVPSC